MRTRLNDMELTRVNGGTDEDLDQLMKLLKETADKDDDITKIDLKVKSTTYTVPKGMDASKLKNLDPSSLADANTIVKTINS